MEDSNRFKAVVLAAGKGSRMREVGKGLPKVLMPLLGRPILCYVLDALSGAGLTHPVVVVSPDGEALVSEAISGCVFAIQYEPLGSADAVMCAREAVGDVPGLVVVCGDSPLFTSATIRKLMDTHEHEAAVITLTTAVLDNPEGYGRVIRFPSGNVVGVVEEKKASHKERTIREVNGGCYAFDARWLWGNLETLVQKNLTGEFCLTEMVGIAVSQGRCIATVETPSEEILGVNTPEDLTIAEGIFRATRLRR